ncbi:hypothetical protein C8J57DRAFT_1494043 [Mycena rebaudengoi]|nr:hypothetical protein C8J57DRAFT_1494043 [Mycena rebaudengoi]
MAEFALINIDKREIVDSSDAGGYGWKLNEAISSRMPIDIIWLFTVLQDNQAAPTRPAATGGRRSKATPSRVSLGHWAGDRVLIVDEYAGRAQDHLPAGLLAEYLDTETDDILEFALSNLKHVTLPGYKHQGDEDSLFPRRHRTRPGHLGRRRVGPLYLESVQGSRGESRGERLDIQALSVVENSAGAAQWEDLSKNGKRMLSEFKMYYDQYLSQIEYPIPFVAIDCLL